MSRSAIILFLSLVVHAASAQDLSIKDVAARPTHFNGKRVSVIGYFVAAHEECCLYTSRKAARRVPPTADLQAGHIFWIEFLGGANRMVLNNHYGRFTGVFRYRAIPKDPEGAGFGQWGLFSSQLEVTSYEPVR
jgi:hypothetical protein